MIAIVQPATVIDYGSRPPTPRYSWRGCGPATAYQAGFEDSRYNAIYRNPFPSASEAWHQYDAGHEDARRNAKEQRV